MVASFISLSFLPRPWPLGKELPRFEKERETAPVRLVCGGEQRNLQKHERGSEQSGWLCDVCVADDCSNRKPVLVVNFERVLMSGRTRSKLKLHAGR